MSELFQHQVEVIPRVTHSNFGMWHDAGIGKTRSALEAFRYLHQTHQADVLLVVCPKIARNVWVMEAATVGMARPHVVIGQRSTDYPEASIVVINYDLLQFHIDYLMRWASERKVVLCFDEAQNLRSRSIKRYRAATKLTPFCKLVWELTGTPYVNSAMDLYWELRLLGPAFPFYNWTASRFGEKFAYPRLNTFSNRWEYRGLRNEEELMAKLAPIVDRRLAKDCLDLPTTRRVPRWLSKQDNMGVDFSSGNVASSLQKARSALSLTKAKLTIAYIEQEMEAVRPIIVIGYHHAFMNAVAAHFDAPIIDGNAPEAFRNNTIAAYERGEVPVLVGQIQAMGTAVTLVKGNHMIFGELHWSAVDHYQAERRISRPGQERECEYSYLLVANSVESLVWDTVLKKGKAIAKLDKAATMNDREEVSLQDLVPLFTAIAS